MTRPGCSASDLPRLRRHWQFINELRLFEIHHQKHTAFTSTGSRCTSLSFLTATSLYHPDTVVRSLCTTGPARSRG